MIFKMDGTVSRLAILTLFLQVFCCFGKAALAQREETWNPEFS